MTHSAQREREQSRECASLMPKMAQERTKMRKPESTGVTECAVFGVGIRSSNTLYDVMFKVTLTTFSQTGHRHSAHSQRAQSAVPSSRNRYLINTSGMVRPSAACATS